jgi:hypothetical protein
MGMFDKVLGNSGSSLSSGSSSVGSTGKFSKLFETSDDLDMNMDTGPDFESIDAIPQMSFNEKLFILSTQYEMPKDVSPKLAYSKTGDTVFTVVGEGKDRYYTRYTNPITGKTEPSWVKKTEVDFDLPEDKKKLVSQKHKEFNERYVKGQQEATQAQKEKFESQSGFDKFNDMLGVTYRKALVGDQGPGFEMTTGSKVGDIGIDILGAGTAFGINPGGGASSLWGGFSKIGNKVGEKVFSKVATKGAEKLGEKVADKAFKEGVTFAAMGAYESAVQEKNPGEAVKTIAGNFLLGAGFGAAGKLLGEGFKALKGLLKKTPAELSKVTETVKFDKLTNEAASSTVKATSPKGKFTVKNKGWDKAVDDYNEAITKIQNHFKTNELRASEIPLIKSELKIDLDGILSRMEKYETKTGSQLMKDAESLSKSRRAAGLATDKTYRVMDTLKNKKPASIQDNVNAAAGVTPEVMGKAKATESLIKKKIELPFEEGAGTEMVKRSDIEKFISESLDIPVAQGKFRQKAYGIFKVKPEIIRLKETKDLETMYHETGHFLDKKLNLRNQGFDNELLKMGEATSKPDYTPDVKKAEGVAEFMRHYLVDPVMAEAKAPKFYKYIESVLKKDTRLDGMLKTLQKATENYIKQDPELRLLSNVSIGGKKSIFDRAKEKLNPQRLYTLAIDELKPLQSAVEEITGGTKISANANPFELAWLNRGWQGRAEAFLKNGVVDQNFKKTGKSFEEIIKPISKEISNFRSYAIAKRALELSSRNIETGMLKGDINYTLNKYVKKSAEYDKILKDLVGYQDNVMNELVDQGVLSKEAVESMRSLNKDYIPFNRVMEQFQKKGTGKGYQAYSPVKGIKGSTRDIVDPLESIIKNTYVMVNIAERNRVGKALIELGEKFDGTGKFFDKVPPKMMGQTIQLKDIEKALTAAGADTSTINLEQIASIFKPNRITGKDNIITVFKDGAPEYYEVFDETLYRSMLALDKESTNTLIKLMSYPAQLLRAGATLTPEFIARNPLRDTMSAFIYSKYGFIPVVDTARGLFKAVVAKSDLVAAAAEKIAPKAVANAKDMYLKWISSGAANSTFVSMDRDYLQKNLRSMLAKSMKDKTLNIITHPIDAVRAFSEFTEIATRLQEFSKGVAKEGASAEGIRKAAIASRDITLDFARGGTVSKHANKIIAFFNASLQGTDKMVRSFSPEKINGKLDWSKPLKTSAKAMAGITLPSVLLYMANKDDKRYQELPQWQKDTFWIILGKEKIYRIPKPFELGILFGTVPERMLQWIEGNDKTAFDGFAERLKETFVPDVIPTALMPLIEAWTNYSFFKGRNIVTQNEKNLEPWAQYSAYTSETAKLIGKALNKSPKIIENTISGYGGGVANMGVSISDILLKASGLINAGKLPKETIESWPLFKGFMIKPYENADSIEDFYNELGKLSTAANTAKDQGTTFKEASRLKLMNAWSKQLSGIRKQVDGIYKSNNYSPEKKRDLIDNKIIQMINIARKALKRKTIKNDEK